MKPFWSNSKYIDERIISTQNKIYKESYFVVMILCLVSIAVKFFLYGYDLRNVVSELIIIIIPNIYYSIKAVFLGVYSDGVEIHDRTSKMPMSVKTIISGLCGGIIIAIFFGIRSAILYAHTNTQRAFYFIIVFFVCLMIYCPFFIAITAIPHLIANKAGKKLNSKDEE